MLHKLLGPTTMMLWVLNFAFVTAIRWWPDLDENGAGQRLLIGITIAVTVAWLLQRAGIEYRIGYRHGREDESHDN